MLVLNYCKNYLPRCRGNYALLLCQLSMHISFCGGYVFGCSCSVCYWFINSWSFVFVFDFYVTIFWNIERVLIRWVYNPCLIKFICNSKQKLWLIWCFLHHIRFYVWWADESCWVICNIHFIVSIFTIFVPTMSISICCCSTHHVCEGCIVLVLWIWHLVIPTVLFTIPVGKAVLPTFAPTLWCTSSTSSTLSSTNSGASSSASSVLLPSSRVLLLSFGVFVPSSRVFVPLDSEPHSFHVRYHSRHERCHGRIWLRGVGDSLIRWRMNLKLFLSIVSNRVIWSFLAW